jgi:hypothetical protein
MQLCPRSVVARVAASLAFLFIAYWQSSPRAQQPEPLRLTAPAPHVVQAAAPPAQAQPQTQTAQGELLDVDAKASTFTIKAPTTELTFRYNDQTKVTGDQKGLSGLATMTGSQVTVQFRKDGQMNLATSIDVRAAK